MMGLIIVKDSDSNLLTRSLRKLAPAVCSGHVNNFDTYTDVNM